LISQMATLIIRLGVGFKPNSPLTEKSEVNGENRIPLYTEFTFIP